MDIYKLDRENKIMEKVKENEWTIENKKRLQLILIETILLDFNHAFHLVGNRKYVNIQKNLSSQQIRWRKYVGNASKENHFPFLAINFF